MDFPLPGDSSCNPHPALSQLEPCGCPSAAFRTPSKRQEYKLAGSTVTKLSWPHCQGLLQHPGLEHSHSPACWPCFPLLLAAISGLLSVQSWLLRTCFHVLQAASLVSLQLLQGCRALPAGYSSGWVDVSLGAHLGFLSSSCCSD